MESLSDVVYPIGTLEELAEIGADPTRIASCSKRTPSAAGNNRGCPWHRQCRFKAWRDQMHGLKGPLNVGVEIMLSNVDGGAHEQMQLACYAYYSNNLRARQRAQDDTGEIIRIVAYEGDGKSIVETVTKSAPPTAENKLGRAILERHVHEVIPHKRPAERFPAEASRAQIQEQMMDEIERESLSAALGKAGVSRATDGRSLVQRALADSGDGEDGDEAFDLGVGEAASPVGKPVKVTSGKK